MDFFEKINRSFYDNQFIYGQTSRGTVRKNRLPQAINLGDDVISAVLRRKGSPWTLQEENNKVYLYFHGRCIHEAILPQRPAYFDKILSDGSSSESVIAVAGECIPGYLLYPV